MNCHGEIMNLQIKGVKQMTAVHESAGNRSEMMKRVAIMSYARGHRDARHDAAEIALKADARVKELEDGIKLAIAGLSTWHVSSLIADDLRDLLPKEKSDE
jgi:hypothetical protein